MKLRIRDNSLRLRLTQAEVETLNRQGLVTASTAFPGGRKFHYEIESSPASVAPAAHFSEHRLTVRVPETAVLAWASSEQVSMSGEQRLDEGEVLTLLIEKDFRCLAPREGEDESDMFPHPLERADKTA